ncbi:HAMP domain-containing histidine kinase [Nocardia cyriacigeorgica]|uniref:Signal transduction histidine-protein kinase/phosphatase MprB n=1 Tax=Nocardia cyriacigeorgica TaxID=135487 RepID=A0A6P1D8C7_9NOCA|nr:ATP-binding protein [Nocardia cyriacigeorgica]NEW41835.1 HAMP domain-containing histidine kinase [Nocardia cyriacigeorgica]NEW45879.1 HAMP domain-containing histidine kinase [Nocardia cyriacigeorgica]NEW52498.1 HAMP domain-containing histidine kinase [Nocardia cyriacigeorgica]NEW56747.1 HAMP domain-containing histidine kinase [Nocardia cyriacigeorgica]
MRRRILRSMLTVLMLTTVALGVPLTYTAWLWVEDITRNDLQSRLERIAVEVIAQERDDGRVHDGLDLRTVRPLVPEDGRLTIVYPAPHDNASQVDIGAERVRDPLLESLSMGASGSLRLEVPSAPMHARQRQAVAVVGLAVLASLGAAVAVAVVTARRVADPLRDVAARAARLAMGDFRPDPRRHGIAELDRVSDVLDSATVEIAGRLQREHALVADVSHQLRSRLTAVRLRLDELSAHRDPDVVHEAEEAMAQVDRLTEAIDDLVRASRDEDATERDPVPVMDELRGIVTEWTHPFTEAGRTLELTGDRQLRAPITGSRLREAVAVLIDNALMHGGGTCTVSVRTVRPGGDREPLVCVEIADEGDGVSDELAPHIFDRGFSGAGSTGVGLALARALIEADGGRLELQRRRPALFAVFLGAPPTTRQANGVVGEPR